MSIILLRGLFENPAGTETPGGGGDTEEVGIIYSKSLFTDLADFSTSGSVISASIVDNAIQISGAEYPNQVDRFLKLPFTDADEKIVGTILFNSLSAGTGIGISKLSVNTWNPQSIYGMARMDYGVSQLWSTNVIDYSQPDPNSAVRTSEDAVTLNTSHNYRFTFEIDKWSITSKLENLTTFEEATCTFVGGIPNTADLKIHTFGGTQKITSIEIRRKSLKNAPILLIGDSKTKGANASALANRYADLINAQVYAGSADRTIELLNSVPAIIASTPVKVIIGALGRNDLASSVTFSTTEANILSIKEDLEAAGIDVYAIPSIPELAQNQSTLDAYYRSIFDEEKIIDMTGWNNDTMVHADSIHPNDLGHAHIASRISDILDL